MIWMPCQMAGRICFMVGLRPGQHQPPVPGLSRDKSKQQLLRVSAAQAVGPVDVPVMGDHGVAVAMASRQNSRSTFRVVLEQPM